ncbi:hypothetical protein RJT34_32023 [Clitoria ternatea]|uniref:Uncharacterized protein n=1 Tax=Clitoria ternatea TaxID=43366 RepID=A0AAN9I447_CLITE
MPKLGGGAVARQWLWRYYDGKMVVRGGAMKSDDGFLDGWCWKGGGLWWVIRFWWVGMMMSNGGRGCNGGC